MTVALGLVCSDGVVVASDSQGTSEHDTSNISRKVHVVDGLPAIWTASGAVYCIEQVAADAGGWKGNNPLRKAFEDGDVDKIRNMIDARVRPKLKEAYDTALPLGARQMDANTGKHMFHTSFLFLGWAADTPWFLEFDGNGQLNWHTETRLKAVGSGGAFADVAGALMSHLVEGEDLSLEWGKRVAYRAVETTCNISSGLVSLPVQLAVVDADGARVLAEEEVQEVRTAVGGWRQLERELVHEAALPLEPAEQPPTLEEETE